MAFVASGGALRSVGYLNTMSYTGSRMNIGGLSWDYLEIWRRQYAVRTAVSFLGRNIAQLGLPVFRRKGDADRERLTDHPLARLIERPNPWTTRYRFLDALVHDMAVFDRSYWLKDKSFDGLSLVRLFPPAVEPLGKNVLYPQTFEYRTVAGVERYDAGDVLFFRGYSGGVSDVGGIPPIESLRDVLEESYYASTARAQTMRNGARTSGYLMRPAESPWSDTARGRFKADWQQQYTGDGPQAGGTPILEDGMTYVPSSITPKDLQYIEARKLTREEVGSAYYIPPPMLGLLENATYSNITEQHQMLYSDTLGPWLCMIQDELSLQLIPDLPDSTDIYCEFNMEEKLRGRFEDRQAALSASVGGPWLLRNEARALDNRPPIEGGDELIQPLNTTTPGDHNPIPAEKPGAEDMPKLNPPKAFTPKPLPTVAAMERLQTEHLLATSRRG